MVQKSQTTTPDVQKPANYGVYYLWTGAGFLPPTVVHFVWVGNKITPQTIVFRGGRGSQISHASQKTVEQWNNTWFLPSYMGIIINHYKDPYCWLTKSCTTKDDDYPIMYRVLTIPGGAGFLPSTVWNNQYVMSAFFSCLPPYDCFRSSPRQLIPNKYHVPHELFALMEYLSVVRGCEGVRLADAQWEWHMIYLHFCYSLMVNVGR